MSEENTEKRPTTVTFNVDYNRAPTRASDRSGQASSSESSLLRPISRKANVNVKTADVSHMTDTKRTPNVPSFIPDEFKREIQTPIPVRPGTTSYAGAIFPSPVPTDSRQEVENLGQWLNSVLQKNQSETKDPNELATNARHWFTIAYDELCRQVSAECPERSILLLSIWKRYQALFARVVQLHQEEKTYLVTCHKERTSALKGELDQTQAKLKQITQQYRDDQERWSNSRERDETKFANMRKKLDLQVKNKRSLGMQIKALRDQMSSESQKDPNQKPHEEEEIVDDKDEPKADINKHTVVDRAHSSKQRVRSEFPYMFDALGALEDIIKFIDQDKMPSNNTRDIFPSILHELSSLRSPRIRSLNWVISAITYFYSSRLLEICKKHAPFAWSSDRHHFASLIYQQLLVIFGTPTEASETFFDLVETARQYSEKENNLRCKMFLQFIDVLQPYRDCVYLDFYIFCLGSFLITNTQQRTLFPDNLENNPPDFSLLSGSMATELAKKVLYSISDGFVADGFIKNMKEELDITVDTEKMVSADKILNFLMGTYAAEECRMSDQLREQYEMDAAQYGGIVTLGQFQTLAMFSPKKLDPRGYAEMMRKTMVRSTSKTVSFKGLIETMHRNMMLVPFSFERIDYNIEEHLEDMFGFMRQELLFHHSEIESKLEKSRKTDDSLFKQLNGAKAKFEQVVDTRRVGLFTEVAQRELYEKLRSISNE